MKTYQQILIGLGGLGILAVGGGLTATWIALNKPTVETNQINGKTPTVNGKTPTVNGKTPTVNGKTPTSGTTPTQTTTLRACLNGAHCGLNELCHIGDSGLVCTDGNVSDCSLVKCEGHLECVEDNQKAFCICSSGYVMEAKTTETGSQRLCHKTCDDDLDCKQNELCNIDNDLGPICIGRQHLTDCHFVFCAGETRCEMQGGHPICKCPADHFVKEITLTTGEVKTLCPASCIETSNCGVEELCIKDSINEPKYCADASTVADCSNSNLLFCPTKTECGVTRHGDNVHAQCLCEGNESTMLAQDGPIGSTRSCHPSCINSDGCVPSDLCVKDSITRQKYCTVASSVPNCEDWEERVFCPYGTECRPTLDDNSHAQCVCTGPYAAIVAPDGLTGSTRSCQPACWDSEYCGVSDLCIKDLISRQNYCTAASTVTNCDDWEERLVCPGGTQCGVIPDDNNPQVQCLCTGNESTMLKPRDDYTTRSCLPSCINSDDCKTSKLCVKDFLTKQKYCTDAFTIEDCVDWEERLFCPDETECRLTGGDNPEVQCLCDNGQSTKVVANGSTGSTRSCLPSCLNTNLCGVSDVCVTNLNSRQKYCTAANTISTCYDWDERLVCPRKTRCGRTPDGDNSHAQCLCTGYESTKVVPSGATGSSRTCHPTCGYQGDCTEENVCVQDSNSKQKFCVASANTDSCNDVTCGVLLDCESDGSTTHCTCLPNQLGDTITVGNGSRTTCHDTCEYTHECKQYFFCSNGLCKRRAEITDGCDSVTCYGNQICDWDKGLCLCDLREEIVVDRLIENHPGECHAYCSPKCVCHGKFCKKKSGS